jgi:hypothetical protein
MAVTEEHVPSPADAPEFTAEELLAHIAGRGGRIFRMAEILVFCLTQDEQLAFWLLKKGGKSFLPPALVPADLGPRRAYKRTSAGPWEWDIYIHTIPVRGEQTIWEAAQSYPRGRHDGSD